MFQVRNTDTLEEEKRENEGRTGKEGRGKEGGKRERKRVRDPLKCTVVKLQKV